MPFILPPSSRVFVCTDNEDAAECAESSSHPAWTRHGYSCTTREFYYTYARAAYTGVIGVHCTGRRTFMCPVNGILAEVMFRHFFFSSPVARISVLICKLGYRWCLSVESPILLYVKYAPIMHMLYNYCVSVVSFLSRLCSNAKSTIINSRALGGAFKSRELLFTPVVSDSIYWGIWIIVRLKTRKQKLFLNIKPPYKGLGGTSTHSETLVLKLAICETGVDSSGLEAVSNMHVP